ncbi:MAG: acylglycerol kinase family protein, partial [Bacteroidales bacterium]|nr:acylglycerol kinase family protein [Candidatus Cacconaster equifaecalis]
MTRVLFIVNPIAGKGIVKSDLSSAFSRCCFEWTSVQTEYPGHAYELARGSDADIIVAVGGDGTVNEVASA